MRKRKSNGFLLLLLWVNLGTAGCFRSFNESPPLIRSGQYVAVEPIKSSHDAKRLYYSYSFYQEGWAYITVVDDHGLDAIGGRGTIANYKQSAGEITFFAPPEASEDAGIFEAQGVTVLSEKTLLQKRTKDKLKYKGPSLNIIRPASSNQANETGQNDVNTSAQTPPLR